MEVIAETRKSGSVEFQERISPVLFTQASIIKPAGKGLPAPPRI
jgi:hypothetical protein